MKHFPIIYTVPSLTVHLVEGWHIVFSTQSTQPIQLYKQVIWTTIYISELTSEVPFDLEVDVLTPEVFKRLQFDPWDFR